MAATDDWAAALPDAVGVELSRRETEVLELLAVGMTNREVAGRLHISVRTAEFHRDNIRAKLDISSRAELVAYARMRGLWRRDAVDA